jgi:hypothetical protein
VLDKISSMNQRFQNNRCSRAGLSLLAELGQNVRFHRTIARQWPACFPPIAVSPLAHGNVRYMAAAFAHQMTGVGALRTAPIADAAKVNSAGAEGCG